MAIYDKDTVVHPRKQDRIKSFKQECEQVDSQMNNKNISAYQFNEGRVVFKDSVTKRGYT